MSGDVLTPSTAATLNIASTPPIRMSTLTKVELRKMVDTRAGFWLLFAIAALTAVIVVIYLLSAPTRERTFLGLFTAAGTPQGLLLPVLGILLVTQEWGQRTAMVTFSLEPRRRRVIAAKTLAATIWGIIALVLTSVIAWGGALIGGAADPWVHIDGLTTVKLFIFQVGGVLSGVAFGLMMINSAAAIVTSFLFPIVVAALSHTWSALASARPWIDLSTTSTFLTDGSHLSATQWGNVASTNAIWVLLPFVIGLWRLGRIEVK